MYENQTPQPWVKPIVGMRHGPEVNEAANQALLDATDAQIEREAAAAQKSLVETTARLKSIEFLRKFRAELAKGYPTTGGVNGEGRV